MLRGVGLFVRFRVHELAAFVSHAIPAGSALRGGDATVDVLPTPFYSVFLSTAVFMALSTVFHSTNSPDNSPFSYSVL